MKDYLQEVESRKSEHAQNLLKEKNKELEDKNNNDNENKETKDEKKPEIVIDTEVLSK